MNPKKQLEYDSQHSAPQHHFCVPQPSQRTPFIPNMTATTVHQPHAPRCTTYLHHTPRCTTIHPKLHHAPQRTNTIHHTTPRSGSPDPETSDAPGVYVFTAEAVAPCGYLAPMVQVKKKANSMWLLNLAVDCWLLH